MTGLDWRSAPVLRQFQIDTVFPFFALGAMNPQDLRQPVEDSGTESLLSHLDFGKVELAGVRVAACQLILQDANGFRVTESFSREMRVIPAEDKALFRRAEAASKNVIERIQVAAPFHTGNQHTRYLVVELIQGREVAAVNLIDHLLHTDAPLLMVREECT